jgi:hypothetical protein
LYGIWKGARHIVGVQTANMFQDTMKQLMARNVVKDKKRKPSGTPTNMEFACHNIYPRVIHGLIGLENRQRLIWFREPAKTDPSDR